MILSDKEIHEICEQIVEKAISIKQDITIESILQIKDDIQKVAEEIVLPNIYQNTCLQELQTNKIDLLALTASIYEHSRYKEISTRTRELLNFLKPNISELADLYQFTTFRLIDEPYKF